MTHFASGEMAEQSRVCSCSRCQRARAELYRHTGNFCRNHKPGDLTESAGLVHCECVPAELLVWPPQLRYRTRDLAPHLATLWALQCRATS